MNFSSGPVSEKKTTVSIENQQQLNPLGFVK
jgi:hypothetical protein